jgi:hypothetical protein
MRCTNDGHTTVGIQHIRFDKLMEPEMTIYKMTAANDDKLIDDLIGSHLSSNEHYLGIADLADMFETRNNLQAGCIMKMVKERIPRPDFFETELNRRINRTLFEVLYCTLHTLDDYEDDSHLPIKNQTSQHQR